MAGGKRKTVETEIINRAGRDAVQILIAQKPRQTTPEVQTMVLDQYFTL
jgi:hypothetical protein